MKSYIFIVHLKFLCRKHVAPCIAGTERWVGWDFYRLFCFLVNIRICQSKEQFFEIKQFSFKHSTSDKWGFSKIEVPTCVDETICECWWINIICLRRLNFSLSSHVSYLHFYRCVDFTCLMDKKMEMLKNSFSLFMFKKTYSVVLSGSETWSNWCCFNKKDQGPNHRAYNLKFL